MGPLPGIGIASTTDFVNYEIINTTWMEPYGANGTASEIVLEAATPPVQLSTGDYFHIYAAGECRESGREAASIVTCT